MRCSSCVYALSLPMVRLSHRKLWTLPQLENVMLNKFIHLSICCEIRERRNTWYFVCDLFCAFILWHVMMPRCHQKNLNISLLMTDCVIAWPHRKMRESRYQKPCSRIYPKPLCRNFVITFVLSQRRSLLWLACVLSPFVGPPCISLYQLSQAVTAIIGFLRPPTFKRWLNEAKTSRTFTIHVYLACFACK